MCQGEGRYVFVVLPGTNRTLALCDVDVTGLSNDASSTVINGLTARGGDIFTRQTHGAGRIGQFSLGVAQIGARTCQGAISL